MRGMIGLALPSGPEMPYGKISCRSSRVVVSACCPRPRRVRAPIDLVAEAEKIRLRHLPGEICLNCREVVSYGESQAGLVARVLACCLETEMQDPTILKVMTHSGCNGSIGETCCLNCDDAKTTALLDVALGPGARVVMEGVTGTWCRKCHRGEPLPTQETLVHRLHRLSGATSWTPVPSLIYDCPQHPTSIQMEVTRRCNLRCAYCSNRLLDDHDSMALNRFVDILGAIDFPCVDHVDLTGLGEPTLHDSLPAMVGEIRRRSESTTVGIVTNGTLFRQGLIEALCAAGISSIAFSIDSLNAERFARVRSRASLSSVLRNLESLVAYKAKKQLNELDIRIKTVLLANAYDEADRIMEYCARLGLSMPHFFFLDQRRKAQSIYRETWLKDGEPEHQNLFFHRWADTRWTKLASSGQRLQESARATGDGEWSGGYADSLLTPWHDVCPWVVDSVFITADGTLLPCCEQMIDRPRIEWGSLPELTLHDLWQGDLLWGYRLPLACGSVPAGCVGCSWEPRQGAAKRQGSAKTD